MTHRDSGLSRAEAIKEQFVVAGVAEGFGQVERDDGVSSREDRLGAGRDSCSRETMRIASTPKSVADWRRRRRADRRPGREVELLHQSDKISRAAGFSNNLSTVSFSLGFVLRSMPGQTTDGLDCERSAIGFVGCCPAKAMKISPRAAIASV